MDLVQKNIFLSRFCVLLVVNIVDLAGKNIVLTSKEYALLEYLMLNVNNIVTRTMIYEHVWEEDFDSMTNLADVYVNYLRNKIDKGHKKKLLHTIRGTGYIIRE